MKQTNNAIKFLMAQYRAIFQNAYFKGLATAAVVTMGLAAGQAQAAAAADNAVLEVGDSVTPKNITIDGKATADGTATGIFKNIAVSEGTLTLKEYTINVEAESSEKNKISAANSTAGKLEVGTLNISIGATGKKADGLSVEGSDQGTATLSASTINITKGTLTAKGATNAGSVNVNTLTVGGDSVATPDDANLAIGALGTVGYALDGDGSKATDGEIKDVANYTTVNLDKNSKLAATSSADNTILNAALLTINGGNIAVTAGGSTATDSLTINLAQGELKAGTITTAENGVLNVNFTDKDFVKSGDTVEKTLTLTKGKLTLGGELTLSGEGKLIVANKGADLKATGAKGVTLTSDAAYAPETIADANAVAKVLPLTIGSGGILDLGQSLDLTQTANVPTFDANADKDTGTIGLVAGGIVKAKDTTLDKDLVDAAAVAQADTITLKNPSGSNEVTFKKTVLSANSNLNLDSSKVKVTDSAQIVLGKESAKTIAASDAYKKADADKKALLLGHTGSINSTNGTLTITSGGVMTVANGTWTSNADIVLAKESGNAGALKVGTETYDSAAILSLEGKKLTTTEGAITIGGNNTKYAELDLTGATIEHTKTDVTIEKNGVLKLTGEQAQELLTGSKSSDFKTLIKGGATLAVAGDLELEKADFTTGTGLSGDVINLSGTGSTADTIATLKVDGSLTIKDANDFKVGQHNKLVAQGLVLNSGDSVTPENVSLGSGEYVLNTLTSDFQKNGKALDVTLGTGADVQFGTISPKKAADGSSYSVQDLEEGSTNLNLVLNGATTAPKVTVLSKNWTGKNVTLTQGTFTVGGTATDINNNILGSKATIDELSVTAATGVFKVSEGSSATVNSLDLKAGDATNFTVNGKLTVNGLQSEETDPTKITSLGLSTAAGSVIKVDGANAELTLGETVLSPINFKDDGTVKYDTAKIKADPFAGKIDLNNFATLSLKFADKEL